MLSYDLAQYRFIKPIGRGAFATVYKVERTSDKNIYALKKTKIKTSSSNKIQGSLHHPNIIRLYDCFYDQISSSLVTVTQYMEGGDLEAVVQDNSIMKRDLEQNQIWSWSYQILKALAYLHKNGVIHRDVKCANVLLSGDRKVVKLTDLNTSKIVKRVEQKTKTKAGTPFYLSPEIWQQKQYSNKCDIWSLGCMVYELCNNYTPFQGITQGNIKSKVMKGLYQPIKEIYSKQLRIFVNQCLTVNQQLRPSAEQLLSRPYFKKLMIEGWEDKQNEPLLATIKMPKHVRQLREVLPRGEIRRRNRSYCVQVNSLR